MSSSFSAAGFLLWSARCCDIAPYKECNQGTLSEECYQRNVLKSSSTIAIASSVVFRVQWWHPPRACKGCDWWPSSSAHYPAFPSWLPCSVLVQPSSALLLHSFFMDSCLQVMEILCLPKSLLCNIKFESLHADNLQFLQHRASSAWGQKWMVNC